MNNRLELNGRQVGEGLPVYLVAEIGINHNGDLNICKRLIDAAIEAGCHAVKFQKRTPEICVPPGQRNIERDTPWGRMSYLEYRHRIEFGTEGYAEIERYCIEKGITWFASPWDEPSVDFLEEFNVPCFKVPSACLTDDALLSRISAANKPVILSTGMSTMAEIDHAVSLLDSDRLILTHCTSTYPCPSGELNLRMINTLRERFKVPVGYSGHEVGLPTTVAAVALGACLVERHITLSRASWGSDQSASVEPDGFRRLVRHIWAVEAALGDGVKQVYDSELPIKARLRRISP